MRIPTFRIVQLAAEAGVSEGAFRRALRGAPVKYGTYEVVRSILQRHHLSRAMPRREEFETAWAAAQLSAREARVRRRAERLAALAGAARPGEFAHHLVAQRDAGEKTDSTQEGSAT